MFVSIKPLHVSGFFFTTIFKVSSAVLCAVTIPLADLRSLSLYYYTVCGRMCVSSVCVWCSCLLVICLCFTTQRTQSSGRNSNGTKHSGGPPEDGREKKKTETCRGFILTNTFLNILLVLNVEVIVF